MENQRISYKFKEFMTLNFILIFLIVNKNYIKIYIILFSNFKYLRFKFFSTEYSIDEITLKL